MKKHLAIFTPSVIEQIFAGKKTVETRFSQNRLPPFGQVTVGDVVYLKPSGKEIVGQFIVKKVLFCEGLKPADLEKIKKVFGPDLSLGSELEEQHYFDSRKLARYGTIIFIDRVEKFLTSPVKINKSDRRGWIVLE